MLKFKTDRISREWRRTYPPLRGMILALEDYSRRTYGKKRMTITCLRRTSKENAAEDGHPLSLHIALPIRAADLRIWGWRKDELLDLKYFWDKRLRTTDKCDFVIEHNHIHVEYEK